MRMGGRAALGVAVGCLAVAGCSDDGGGDAVTLPPTTPTATSSATATTSAPTATVSAEPTPTTTLILPDEHVESVDAFVAEFFEALNAAKDSGDFSAFDALYLPQCTGCVELRDEVQGWLADGGSVEGGDWVVIQMSSSQFADGSRGTAAALMYRQSALLIDAGGEEHKSQPATSVQLLSGGLLPASPWVFEDMGYGEAP